MRKGRNARAHLSTATESDVDRLARWSCYTSREREGCLRDITTGKFWYENVSAEAAEAWTEGKG